MNTDAISDHAAGNFSSSPRTLIRLTRGQQARPFCLPDYLACRPRVKQAPFCPEETLPGNHSACSIPQPHRDLSEHKAVVDVGQASGLPRAAFGSLDTQDAYPPLRNELLGTHRVRQKRREALVRLSAKNSAKTLHFHSRPPELLCCLHFLQLSAFGTERKGAYRMPRCVFCDA